MISMTDPSWPQVSPSCRARCQGGADLGGYGGSGGLGVTVRPGSVVEPEAAELLGVTLPVLGDLDVQVEVHLGAQEGFDLVPGPAADVLQPGAPGADDDGLLARPLHIQLGVHVDQVVPAGVRAHL